MEKIKCLRYAPINKGFLEASVSIFVPKWGMEIHDIKIFNKDGRRWLGLPSKVVDNGEKKSFYPYVKFPSKDLMTFFTEQVLESIIPYEAAPPSFPEQPHFSYEDIPF